MKKFLILFLIFAVQNTFSQSGKSNVIENKVAIDESNIVYHLAGVEIKPEFPGGKKEFDFFVNKNYKPASTAIAIKKINLFFIVEKDGLLSDIKVIRDKDLDDKTANEIVSIVKKSPQWIPGQQYGKIVRVSYSTSIDLN